MVSKILATIYEAKKPRMFILIIYQRESNQNIILISLKLFYTEKSLINYAKNNGNKIIRENHEKHPLVLNNLERLLDRYFSGEHIDLHGEIKKLKISLALQEKFKSSFSFKVVNTLLHNAPYGKTVSYSEIANTIGSKAYRAIGTVLKSNPLPLIIPCHRVIRKDGKIGGFMGKKEEGWQTKIKRDLIHMEKSSSG